MKNVCIAGMVAHVTATADRSDAYVLIRLEYKGDQVTAQTELMAPFSAAEVKGKSGIKTPDKPEPPLARRVVAELSLGAQGHVAHGGPLVKLLAGKKKATPEALFAFIRARVAEAVKKVADSNPTIKVGVVQLKVRWGNEVSASFQFEPQPQPSVQVTNKVARPARAITKDT